MCTVDLIIKSPLSPRFPQHVVLDGGWAIDNLVSPMTTQSSQYRKTVVPTKEITERRSRCKKEKAAKVQFDVVVEVRSYNTVLGDNPSVGHGPPVSLGWSYTPGIELLSETETNHPTSYRINAPTRCDRLRRSNFSKQQMDETIVEMDRIKGFRVSNSIRSTIIPVQRIQSNSNGSTNTKRIGSLTWAATPKRSRRADPTRIKSTYPKSRAMSLPVQ